MGPKCRFEHKPAVRAECYGGGFCLKWGVMVVTRVSAHVHTFGKQANTASDRIFDHLRFSLCSYPLWWDLLVLWCQYDTYICVQLNPPEYAPARIRRYQFLNQMYDINTEENNCSAAAAALKREVAWITFYLLLLTSMGSCHWIRAHGVNALAVRRHSFDEPRWR